MTLFPRILQATRAWGPPHPPSPAWRALASLGLLPGRRQARRSCVVARAPCGACACAPLHTPLSRAAPPKPPHNAINAPQAAQPPMRPACHAPQCAPQLARTVRRPGAASHGGTGQSRAGSSCVLARTPSSGLSERRPALGVAPVNTSCKWDGRVGCWARHAPAAHSRRARVRLRMHRPATQPAEAVPACTSPPPAPPCGHACAAPPARVGLGAGVHAVSRRQTAAAAHRAANAMDCHRTGPVSQKPTEPSIKNPHHCSQAAWSQNQNGTRILRLLWLKW